MAKKLDTSKLPRPSQAASETLNRRPQPPAATFFLMQLRTHAFKIAPPDSLRLEVDAEAVSEDPEPVKITWINRKK